jgi:HSP20 family protein
MLMRFDPFRELDRRGEQPNADRPTVMPMDAYRHGDEFVVHFDLPGVDPDSIDLTVEKNVLTIRAERQWQPGEEDEVLISERPKGSFSRQLFLGEGLDTDRISARYDQGVLTIRVPVAEKAKPRKVAIEGNGHGESREVKTETAGATAGASAA